MNHGVHPRELEKNQLCRLFVAARMFRQYTNDPSCGANLRVVALVSSDSLLTAAWGKAPKPLACSPALDTLPPPPPKHIG